MKNAEFFFGGGEGGKDKEMYWFWKDFQTYLTLYVSLVPE